MSRAETMRTLAMVPLVAGVALLVWVFLYVEGAWSGLMVFVAGFAGSLVLAGVGLVVRSYRLPADAGKPCPRCSEGNPSDARACQRCGQAF